MNTAVVLARRMFVAFAVCWLLLSVRSSGGQVKPSEIESIPARAAEEKYFAQISAVHSSIESSKLPFGFKLARYLHAKPGQQAALDHDGIEFVDYNGHIVLKISGFCNASFEASKSSKNERVERAFNNAILPILRLVAAEMPQTDDYDGIGFELLYEKNRSDGSYDYRGKEVVTIIFRQGDAFQLPRTEAIAERQRLLNRSDIFVNGEVFGLALEQREPIDAEVLERFATVPGRRTGNVDLRRENGIQSASYSVTGSANTKEEPAAGNLPNFADAMRLQREYQPQLNSLFGGGVEHLYLAAELPPAFEISGDRILLHFNLRNPKQFQRDSSSIYKRAAQSFDLFLAPELRELCRRLINGGDYDALQFSVVNSMGIRHAELETTDFICPVEAIRAFISNKITSQELIDHSTVLVNGERISLNLQLAE